MDEDLIFPPLLLGGSAWALRPDVLPRVAAASRLQVDKQAFDQGKRLAAGRKAARRGATARAGGSVVVIPLCGLLTPQGSFLSWLFGGGAGGLQAFRDEFAEAVNDPDVGAIVIDVDSPGGLVDLTPETAADIREARGTKPIVAVANTQAASGAYWIASQADELIVTPSGYVGSVGVYMVHEDWSGYEENLGIDTTFVFAGQYKIEGNASNPLSDDAKAAWQHEVDLLYGMFTGDVAAGRDTTADKVKADYGEGRVLLASDALAAGMVDRIATLEEVVAELLDEGASTGGRRSALGIRAELVRDRKASAEQPQCPECGKYMPDEDGRDVCDDCAEPDDDDEDEEELEDAVEDEEEEDAPGAPQADKEAAAADRAALIDVLA